MRVLCIGDSLGLPRKGVCYEDTWFYKLQTEYPSIEFIDFFQRRLLISTALTNFEEYYVHYPSDVVIIQTGICDCAPRYINENEFIWKLLLWLGGLTHTTKLLWRIIKRGNRKPNVTLTSYDDFNEKYRILVNRFLSEGRAKNIIIVKIGHGDKRITSKSEYFNSNADKYNSIFDKIKKDYGNKIFVIDPLNKESEEYFADGYHCSEKGMDEVFICLKDIFEKIIKCYE